jgi:hypothetical protein
MREPPVTEERGEESQAPCTIVGFAGEVSPLDPQPP